MGEDDMELYGKYKGTAFTLYSWNFHQHSFATISLPNPHVINVRTAPVTNTLLQPSNTPQTPSYKRKRDKRKREKRTREKRKREKKKRGKRTRKKIVREKRIREGKERREGQIPFFFNPIAPHWPQPSIPSPPSSPLSSFYFFLRPPDRGPVAS